MVRAALTCVLAALLAGAAYVSVPLTALAVAIGQVALASSWHRLAGAPGARGGFVVGVLAGLAADVVLLLDDEGGRIGPVVGVAAVVVPAAFVHQLLRTPDEAGGRDRMVASMSATVTAAMLCVGLASAIPLSRLGGGRESLLVGLVALGIAVFLADLSGGRLAGLAVGVLFGGGFGLAIGAALGLVDDSGLAAVVAIAIGSAVAAAAGARVGWVGEVVARRVDPALAALPLALAVPVVYALASATVI
jgi:hypothetical protein